MDRRTLLTGGLALAAAGLTGCAGRMPSVPGPAMSGSPARTGTVRHRDAEWRRLLTREQFAVLRQGATERPFTSELLDEHRRGVFACAGCDLGLFSSETKFDSGTGWPSFWDTLHGAVSTSRDTTLGMVRDEVHCHRCGGHLGHVFDDGPRPTGLRYCINGVALRFKPSRSS